MTVKTTYKRKPSRPSKISLFEPALKEAVDTAVREGRATVDQIFDMIVSMGGDTSRSGVGRYVKNANDHLEDYRQAQAQAALWMDKIGKEPDGDVGRMLLETLRMVALRTVRETEKVNPEDLNFLSNAIKGLAQADKLVVDKAIALRKLIAVEAAKVATDVAKTAKKAGLTDETIEMIRSKILGIPEAKKP